MNGSQTTTRLGTQPNGAIGVAGELQWNNSNGANSGMATLEILINGVRYAMLSTSDSSAGLNSPNGVFQPDNGSSISVDGNAETATQQPFVGDAFSSGRTYRPFTIRLPLSVTRVTSVQYLYRSNYNGGGADDDIRFRNIQINQCKASLRIQKVIGGGRVSATNQFTLSIADAGSTQASTTTTGTGTTVGNGTATLAPFTAGTVYTLSEVASGSTTLNSYDTSYACTNASSGTGTSMPSGAGTSFSLTPAAGDDVTCTLVNNLLPPSLSITKASNGPWTVGQPGAAYTLTVGNTGAVSTSGTITVRDQLPSGIGIRPASGFAAATGWTCSYSDEAAQSATTIVPNTGMLIACTSATALAAGGTAVLIIPVVVTSESPSSVVNYASVGGGGDAFNGGTAPTAGPSCSNAAHCASATTGVTASPPAPATCTVGTPVNLLATAPFQSNFFTDSTTETRTATLTATSGDYRLGTGNGGRFVVDMNWKWSPGYPLPSNAATMTLRVNGTNYATMTTQAGFAGYGTLVALNGASLFDGTTTLETNRVSNEDIWVTLPSSVTTITSVQMTYTAGSAADDFFFTGPAIYGCPAPADLSVTKTNTPAQGPSDLANDTYVPGETRSYSIVVRNGGPFGAQNVTVSDPVPAGISAGTVSWTCAATSGGSVCGAASGSGALNDTGLNLPSGAVATYTVTMTVPTGFTGALTNTVTVTPPSNVNDPNPANNTATDTDQAAARVTLSKLSLGGVGAFSLSGSNGVAPQTLTTTVAGTAVSGTSQVLTTAGIATTLTEASPPAGYVLSAINCTGLGGGGTATPDLAARSVTLDAAATASGANITCTFTNSRIPLLRLQKALPSGRAAAADQFTLNMTGMAGLTTTGSGSTATGVLTHSGITIGNSYTLSEGGAGATNLANYSSSYACTNALVGGQTPGGTGTSFSVTPVAGDDLTCTLTNTAILADLQVVKTASPPGAVQVGQVVTYTIVATNNGPAAAHGAKLTDTPVGLNCQIPSATATCTATAGASCPSATVPVASLTGSGITLPAFPNGGSVMLTMQCTVLP
ncbi:DUF11 domain-containing protein [Rhodoferax koreensis]|uniref:DUF11 domain-containing protein n=1 Tax=Rhodoferax koreensis TaxID=1842727 RepID=UPI00139036C6|nr:DUF11 domain-containing protein [Rhodoferax koreense]